MNYAYDNAGRLNTFTGNLGEGGASRNYSTDISYSALGGMNQEQFGTQTAIYNKLFYNSRGQLAEILASTTPSDASFNRGKIVNDYSDQCSGASCNGSDNNGNLKKQETFVPNNDQNTSPASWYQQYSYDKLNRLTQLHEYTGNSSSDWQQQFVYDRYGNRTIDQTNTWGANIPKPNFGVNTATNQLTPPSGTMSYDYAGNLTTDTYSGSASHLFIRC